MSKRRRFDFWNLIFPDFHLVRYPTRRDRRLRKRKRKITQQSRRRNRK